MATPRAASKLALSKLTLIGVCALTAGWPALGVQAQEDYVSPRT